MLLEVFYKIDGVSHYTEILLLAEGLLWVSLAFFIVLIEVALLGRECMSTLEMVR